MENDRELLDLAAKAAGRQVVGWNEQHGVDVAVMKDGSFWQPLLENPIIYCMGDALRLAVKLGIQIDPRDPETRAFGPVGDRIDEYHKPDAFFATRRAIVRAAAGVGRAME